MLNYIKIIEWFKTRKEGFQMSLLTFKGGIHPYEGKELSKDKDIVEYFPKGDVAISM